MLHWDLGSKVRMADFYAVNISGGVKGKCPRNGLSIMV